MKKIALTEDQCWSQWGYYGIALNVKDSEPLVLPEQLLVQSIQYFGDNIDYSKLFSLITDWMDQYHDILRPDLLLKESVALNPKLLAILCGILERGDRRRFRFVIAKMAKRLNREEFNMGSRGRINSFGADPIMKKYGVLCSTINNIRDGKKIFKKEDLIEYCLVIKTRIIIGAGPRSDFFSFRKLNPDKKISEIREVTGTSKTSSVYFERDFKFF